MTNDKPGQFPGDGIIPAKADSSPPSAPANPAARPMSPELAALLRYRRAVAASRGARPVQGALRTALATRPGVLDSLRDILARQRRL